MTPRHLLTVSLALAVIGCAVVPPMSPTPAHADNATLRDDAAYHAGQIKTLAARQQTEIAAARADQISFENAAVSWKNSYDSVLGSWEYALGDWIIRIAKWWLLALLVVFVARMVFVWVGGPIGEFGSHLCTSLLGLLTCFTAYLVNIPDNIYFRRELAARDVTIAQLQSKLQAATLAATGATGAVAAATGGPASVDAAVGGETPASILVSAPAGGAA